MRRVRRGWPRRCWRTGHSVGEVSGHDVQKLTRTRKSSSSGDSRSITSVQQVRRDCVVVAGERVDEPGGICAALQLEGGQPEARGPSLGPFDQPTDVHGVQVDPELAEQGAGLVRRKARSDARISLITPARRNWFSGHGGSRRVVTTNRSPRGGRWTSRSRLSCTASSVTSCRLSSTRTTGAPSAASAAATCPGTAPGRRRPRAGGPRPPGRRRRGWSRSRRTSRNPADRRRRGRARSTPRPCLVPASASQELASSVFPQPAGAAISAQEDSRPVVNRLCNRGRGTRCVASGTANLPSQSVAPPPPLLILPE